MAVELNLRAPLESALKQFATKPLPEAARDFFGTLGYRSDRRLDLGSVPQFCKTYDADGEQLARMEPHENWKSVHLLFQLTSSDIALGSARQLDLLPPEPANLRQFESYLFMALELKPRPDGTLRSRTELCDLARAINRLFPMPVLTLFREDGLISIAITYRRTNKRESSRDVVERKVTLIRDVSTQRPHPGHLAILEDFALSSLSAYRGREIRTFADLDDAWRESLSVELLRRRAYRMLADWYFWARDEARFPPDAEPDADGKPSLHLIRLLTRVIFCWFVKEKSLPDARPLIPFDLFDDRRIRELLKDDSPEAGTYYTAILQNLFFATLNTEMDENGQPVRRRFAREGHKDDHMVHTLWRGQKDLRDPAGFIELLRGVPFLNGGLFECLDERVDIEGTSRTREIRVDGFSTAPDKRPHLPNALFFGREQTIDLSAATGNSQRTAVKVTPLLNILNGFVWTITENTPLEEEVALDPDLLGNVFENLLAAYNPETGTIARNATGSFYTPDYVVDWMIDQALEPLLLAALPPKGKKNEERIRRLLDWQEADCDYFADAEKYALINAISTLRALDPACGSGAYPMGLLKKMVLVLNKLDPSNAIWKARQIAMAERLDSPTARDEALAAIERAFAHDNDDYGRKLYLIENSIYGVDIQPLAVQIAKLRFFITLIVDQPIDPALTNYGILPLPNLETKIVPANTLLGLERGQLLLGSDRVLALEHELKSVRHRYFTARRYSDKKTLRRRDRDLCKQLAAALVEAGECSPADAKRLAEWNPYNTNRAAGFFDPGWMYGLEGEKGEPGRFDLVIGNPPYVRQEELKSIVLDSAGRERPLKDVLKDQYECATGTADLYVYFFERSLQLLRIGGMLSFITSNKYLRAGYGEKLRAYLLYATAPRVLLDFGDAPIFTAIAYPCILVTEKLRDVGKRQIDEFLKLHESPSRFNHMVPHADRNLAALAWKPGPARAEFPDVFASDSIALRQRDLKPSGWRIESGTGLDLLERLRKSGTPLGEYVGGRFYRGVLTGYNEAFVVDRETRDRLINEHASSAEVLKPYLRGRDVKRWRCEPQDLWLIFTRRGIDIKAYPAIHEYLKPHKKRLTPGAPGGRKPGSYEWYEIQDNIAYWEEFERPKIVIPAIQDGVHYAPDSDGYYSNDKTSIVLTASTGLVLGVLNSSVSWWISRQEFPSRQGGFFEFKPAYVEKIPIPAATPSQKALCEAIAGALIALHKPQAAKLAEQGLMVTWFEQWLNGLVYELFFPGELHARGLHLFAETDRLLPGGKLPVKSIPEVFAASRDLKRPLRAHLTDLLAIEEVRIIESANQKVVKR